jgi:hypothetical protein
MTSIGEVGDSLLARDSYNPTLQLLEAGVKFEESASGCCEAFAALETEEGQAANVARWVVLSFVFALAFCCLKTRVIFLWICVGCGNPVLPEVLTSKWLKPTCRNFCRGEEGYVCRLTEVVFAGFFC